MTQAAHDTGPDTVPYASATPPRAGVRIWGATILLLAALGLVALGGCFLIGVLALVTNGFTPSFTHPTSLTPAAIVLSVFLYVLAGGCVIGAAALFVAGVRGMFLVLRPR